MGQFYDVIIVGAGPVGLFLACELGLAGTSVLVLERDAVPQSPWKSPTLGRRAMNTGSVEAIYRRGLLGKFRESGNRDPPFAKTLGLKFAGHFACVTLDAGMLDLSRFKYRLEGPALRPLPTFTQRIETIFTERAESLDIPILRGQSFSKIAAHDADSITVETESGERFRGRWLLGCDGGRSTVRKAAGFEFAGTNSKLTGYVAECTLEDPEGLMKRGFHKTERGMYLVAPDTLYLMDFDSQAFDRATQTVTREHLDAVLQHITGFTNVRIGEIRHSSTFTDRAKQATSYRRGRVLLAGDAAHIHSPLGAQGLNIGMGDAMNLGWKLAATIRREAQQQQQQLNGTNDDEKAEFALLDTYATERQPVGEWALAWTRAQVSALQPDPFGHATHALMRDLVRTVDGTNLMIDRVWGLSLRYGDAAHPLVGCSAPDLELSDGTRLGTKMGSGRGLLVDLHGGAVALRDELLAGRPYEARVDYLALGAQDTRGIRSMLIRPDGVVAWVVDEDAEADIGAAKAALEQWLRF